MLFEEIKIGTHPRTGTHYTMSLIALNFTTDPNSYERLFWTHFIIHKDFIPEKDIAYITVFRDRDKVMDSMWRLRGRFGLKAESFQKFLTTKYKDMFNAEMKSETLKVSYKKHTLVTNKKDESFKYINLCPEEYYEMHKQSWIDFKARYPEQVHIVQYESLLEDFNKAMQELCLFLGADLIKFRNINYKIGWIG